MKVAIDLTALMPKTTGIDVYLLELVRHLALLDRETRYTLFLNKGDRERFGGGFGSNFGSNFEFRESCPPARPARLFFQQCLLPLMMADFDVLHSPSFLMPWWRGQVRHLLTVQDMTFFSMPGMHNRLRASKPFRDAVAMSIRRANLINVPSESTRRDLLHWFPETSPDRLRITPLGINPRFHPTAKVEVEPHLRRLGLPPSYILYLGTIEPRKNVQLLVDCYADLIASGRIDEPLVLAGAPGWDYEAILERVKSPELQGRVYVTGYAAWEDLPWIYRGASMFVYPSLYEGFGLPPLEAMASGVPVISTSTSSLDENLRGAADLVAPRDARALTASIERLVKNPKRREDLVARGLQRAASFRWEQTAQLVLDCYKELAVNAE